LNFFKKFSSLALENEFFIRKSQRLSPFPSQSHINFPHPPNDTSSTMRQKTLSRVMSQQSSEFYFLPIDQNRTKSIKNVQNKAESWKKDSEHKIEKTNDFCQMLHNMRNPTVRKSFAMNGRASGRSIDWKIRELMILIASVHDFNFFSSVLVCPCEKP
jgi:hypothetical protein